MIVAVGHVLDELHVLGGVAGNGICAVAYDRAEVAECRHRRVAHGAVSDGCVASGCREIAHDHAGLVAVVIAAVLEPWGHGHGGVLDCDVLDAELRTAVLCETDNHTYPVVALDDRVEECEILHLSPCVAHEADTLVMLDIHVGDSVAVTLYVCA